MEHKNKPDTDRLITTKEAAEILSTSISALSKARMQKHNTGNFPAFVKVGKSVRYKLSTVNAWIARQAEQLHETPDGE